MNIPRFIADGGDYRSLNPLGYVPALVLDDGTRRELRSSNTLPISFRGKAGAAEQHDRRVKLQTSAARPRPLADRGRT